MTIKLSANIPIFFFFLTFTRFTCAAAAVRDEKKYHLFMVVKRIIAPIFYSLIYFFYLKLLKGLLLQCNSDDRLEQKKRGMTGWLAGLAFRPSLLFSVFDFYHHISLNTILFYFFVYMHTHSCLDGVLIHPSFSLFLFLMHYLF